MQQNLQVQGHLPVTFQITESFFAGMTFSFGSMESSAPVYLWSKIPGFFSEFVFF
jgi:hypothetical protein